MDVLKFSPNEVYVLLVQIQEIKEHIYKTTGRRERGDGERAFLRYFPREIVKSHSYYQSYYRITTEKGLIIEASTQENPRILKLSGDRQNYNVLIQSIEQDGEYQSVICELAPYLNPYLEELSAHVNTLYQQFDISHERKREFLIKQFLN